MDMRTQRFFEEIEGKRVAFCGIGVSHTQAIMQFLKKGAKVYACDKHTREELGETAAQLENAGAVLCLGDGYLSRLGEMDIIFRTPGMRITVPELVEAQESGAVVTSEMEVFFDLCPCKTIAVTGSDGKTTTTTLIAEMLKAQGRRVYLGGNIGKALLPEIEFIEKDDIAVVELSSFQLISMRHSPDIAVVTNLAPNHLDMHKDLEEYINAKKNILLHQNAFSRSVLNLDNHVTRGMRELVRGELLLFSRLNTVKQGVCMEEDTIVMYHHGKRVEIMKRGDIRLVGDHNVENYMAAIAAVWGLVSVENMAKVAREFGGVEHRMEFVRELGGVKWYNDSIATNPTRTMAGLAAYDQKIILLAGGYDKHIPFDPLAPGILNKVKILILMGATADAIAAVVTSHPQYNREELPILRVNSMEEAVSVAARFAKEGDIVALSPASASFDWYKNFEVRGNHFKSLVNAL